MTQEQALKILKTGRSVFLTGEPGSGKTHLINEYVEYLRSHRIEPAITASTGIAATHIGGMTIHSWSGIGIAKNLSKYDIERIARKSHIEKRIRKTRVLIIDEISMLDGATLSVAEAVCREARENELPFGGMQVALVGDFFQLPPVTREGDETRFAFEADAWQKLNPAICYLTEQHRQEDAEFLSVLKAIRQNKFQEEHFVHLESRMNPGGKAPGGITKLFPHNADVDRVNDAELAKLPDKIHSFKMESRGPRKLVETIIKGCLSPEELNLKKGAVVMFTKNSPRDGFVNGTLGKIIGFDRETGYPIVKIKSGKTIEAEPMDWTVEEHGLIRAKIIQIPLRLAWAITVHKSQGMSLDGAVMNLKTVFEYGQGYVALSRVRSLDGLHLLGINDHALLVHPEILEKDAEFRAQSEGLESNIKKISTDAFRQKADEFILSCGGKLKAEKASLRHSRTESRFSINSGGKPEEKISTLDKTLAMFKKGKSIAEIAKERGLVESTILSHIEKLASQDKISPDEIIPIVDALMSSDLKKHLPEIHKIFENLDTTNLGPVREHFGDRFSYDDLRLARMLLPTTERA